VNNVVEKEEEAKNDCNYYSMSSYEDNDFVESTGSGTCAYVSALDNLNLDSHTNYWEDDLDLGDDMIQPISMNNANEMSISSGLDDVTEFQIPKSGRPVAALWNFKSHAAIHIAAGAISSGMQYLNRQIAASEFSKLRISMFGCFFGAFMIMPGTAGSVSIYVPLLKNDSLKHPGIDSLPRMSLKTMQLLNDIRSGYSFFQGGKFNDAKAVFTHVLLDIPLVVTENKKEANETK